MTTRKKILSPKARPGNRNAAKPCDERRVVLVAQKVAPATLVALRERATVYGSIGRAIDAAAQALVMLERSVGTAREHYTHVPPATSGTIAK